jgi:NADPH:quinone reductase-like Zn-dependent oxidoreductase
MKAYFYDKRLKPDRLALREAEKPVPRDNEVVVKIRAVSINAADYRSMELGIVPKKKIYGADISGEIETVGRGARPFAEGDEVVADLSGSGFGGFAEYVAAPVSALARKPSGLSHEECAAVPMAAVTALQALRNLGKIQSGQKVLIVGAGGGVGSFAVQLAKHFGAEVTGVCGTGNAERVLGLGADHVIDYEKRALGAGEARYDLVLAVNGNNPLSLYWKLLQAGGRVIVIGGALPQVLKSLLLGPWLSMGARKMRTLTARANEEDLAFALQLLAEGKMQANIERVYDFADLPQAVKYASEGHARGKIVVRVNQLNG